MSLRWFRLVLTLCPTLVLVLWVAGIAHFRGYGLPPGELVTVLAIAFAAQFVTQRMRAQRPMPPVPKGSNPVTLAAMSATIIGVLAALLCGVLEMVLDQDQPSATSWALRTTWHAACWFAISYCGFLLRLTMPNQEPPTKPSTPAR